MRSLDLAMLAASLGLAACAAQPVRPRDTPPMASLSTALPPGTGIILVVRAVAPADTGSDGAWRGLLLASADGAAAADAPAAPLAEIVVRRADGALLSIVQPADPALRAGASVTIARPAAASGRVTVALL